jgi:hypothetical protein
MQLSQRFLSLGLSVVLIGAVPSAMRAQVSATPAMTTETPEQLQQLVAPIALYPDPLMAQILAASTHPAQVVKAARWLQQNPGLSGDQLGKAADQQTWDPSVKALTPFPSVLANMGKNIAWTSELGDAYVNRQADVMNAIQAMRQKAQAAGTLTSNADEKVTAKGQAIVVEPADPEVVYVPVYDPWTVYGAPFGAWPGYYYYPPEGVFIGAGGIGFGAGIGIGAFGHWGWGWHHWSSDWGHRDVRFDHCSYASRSTVINRNVSRTTINRNVTRNNFGRTAGFNHGAVRGFGAHSATGARSFGGRQGGGFHAGGGGFHGGGGGGFHGGGGHGGGGHR